MIRAALVVTMLAAAATHAAAEGRGDRTSAHRRQARADAEVLATRAKLHYDAGRFDRAAEDYLAAYRLYPAPGLLYNLAQSYRLAGDCAAASGAYQEYLRRAPRSKFRAIVEQHLEELKSCADDETVVASDVPAPVTGRSLRVAGVITGGAGVLLAGLGLYVVRSGDDDEPVRTAKGKDDEDDPMPAADDGGGHELLGGALIGSGGAACVAGLAMYLLGSRSGDGGSGLSLAPSGDGVEMSVRWRF